MELAEIKRHVDNANTSTEDGVALKALYELFCQKIVVEANQAQAITDQQVEIERLRAALIDIKSYISPIATPYHTTLLWVISQVDNALLQQQPEAPQEPLKVRILRYLATCEEPQGYGKIQESIGNISAFLPELMQLVKSGYLLLRSGNFQITAAGRDYLASLDEPEDLLEDIQEPIQETLSARILRMVANPKTAHLRAVEIANVLGLDEDAVLDELHTLQRHNLIIYRDEIPCWEITDSGKDHLQYL